jgi:hypothetical protein
MHSVMPSTDNVLAYLQEYASADYPSITFVPKYHWLNPKQLNNELIGALHAPAHGAITIICTQANN